MSPPHAVVSRQEICEHLDAVVASPPFRGSPIYAALLRYLVESTLNDQTRHEIDIAIDVFGKDEHYDPAESSAVRVRVHQLRKKLDEYYRSVPDGAPIRFSIPKGSYRIAFGTKYVVPGSKPVERASSLRAGRAWLAAVTALLVVSVATNAVLLARMKSPSATDPPLQPAAFAWEAVTEGPEPILIALGDFFVFREASEEGRIRFIRDIEINSPEDLSRLASEPAWARPADLTYLPKSTAFTLEAILPVVQATGKRVSLKLMSEVTGEDLREHDLIYIGFIRSMGPLQDYFFRSSSFSSPHPFVQLHDKKSGEVFVSSEDSFGHTRDYGLFARIPGPGKGDMLIFTGIRDIGILHAVRALTEPDRARELAEQVGLDMEGVASPIEILFEVSGYHRTDLQATIVRANRAVTNPL
ncbi:MAG TPA: hypothetical protein VIN61_16190 [Gammaproteobacteria bacterium]